MEHCVKRGNRNYNTDIVLDLINRQKAEIERLNKKVEELSDVLSDTIKIRYAEAKAEAYKDFAEHLKEEWFNNDYYSPDAVYVNGMMKKEAVNLLIEKNIFFSVKSMRMQALKDYNIFLPAWVFEWVKEKKE